MLNKRMKVCLESDPSIVGVIEEVCSPEIRGDEPLYRVKWDKFGSFLYTEKFLKSLENK